MKEKLLTGLVKLKELVLSLAAKAPFTVGVVAGYLGAPLISAGIAVVRAALGLL